MTVSGVWSRYRRARPPTHHAWAVGSRFSPTRLTRTLLSVSEQPSLIISVERPRGLSSPPHDERLTASQSSVVPACYMCQVRPGRQTRDRSYLVLAKPSVIMNDIRRRGWRFPGGLDLGSKRAPGTSWTTGLNLPTAAPVVLMRWAGMICTQPDECRPVGSTRAGRRRDGGGLLHQVRWHQR
jgi:hypothetical protein